MKTKLMALEALKLALPHINPKAIDGVRVEAEPIADCYVNTIVSATIAAIEADIAKPVEPPFGTKRKAAMAIYTPPFVFIHGYVYDSKNNMVADQGGFGDKDTVERAVALQIRGWGRIGYMPNAQELQNEVGAMCVDALNAYYTTPQEPVPRAPYGWQVQGLRDTFKGNHAELDSKSEAARVGGTAYAFPIYIDPPAAPGGAA